MSRDTNKRRLEENSYSYDDSDTPKKKSKRVFRVVTKVLIVLLLITVFNTMYIVNENEYAYITRLSKMVDVHNNAGLNFKAPFIDHVSKIPTYKMLYDIPPSEVITADKKTLVVDNFVVWKVIDAGKFVQRLRGSTSEMEARISASVYSAVKNEFGRLMRENIISTDPTSVEKVSEKVTDTVNKSLSDYGISVVAVEIKKTDLPEDNAESVYKRMIAEREQIAAAYIAEGELEAAKIKNDVDKQVEVILATAQANAEKRRGEAEAEYMKILSTAYSSAEKADFYRFLRQLDATEEAFSGKESTIIIDENSEIAKALLGNA